MSNSTSNYPTITKKNLICACAALAVYALVYILIKLFADPSNEFWLTAFNMRVQKGYDHTAFKLFGPLHLSELVIAFIVSVIGYNLFKRTSEENRTKTLRILAMAIFCEELLKDVVLLATGQFMWDHLPFHLCGVNIFIALWYAFKPNRFLPEFLYGLGLSGTWVALITTSWQACPLNNFSHLHSVFFHTLLAVYCILVLAGGFKPHIWNIWRVFVILPITIIPAIIFDYTVDTNFFFLRYTENNPILEIINKLCGRFYIAGLMGLAAVCVFVMYIPWMIRDIIIYLRKNP